MSASLINYGIMKLYIPNLQNKTSCYKKSKTFLKLNRINKLEMNNETTCLTNALESQIYFMFIVILSIALSMRCQWKRNDY